MNRFLRISRFVSLPSFIIAAVAFVFAGSVPANAADQEPGKAAVSFMEAPPGAKLVTIPLAVVESPGSPTPGYLAQRSSRPVEPMATVPPGIADAYSGKEVLVYEIAALPDGTRFVVALNDDKNIKFLNRNESAVWFARIYRIAAEKDAKPEVLREGFQMTGNDVTVPVEFNVPPIGTTKVKTLRTEVGYNINSMQGARPQVYGGRGAGLQVAGSQVGAEGKITITVSVPEELKVTPETQVTLRFEPLKPGLPERTAAAKVTDFLTLGGARFVVTSLAEDFSSVTIAVVSGSLEETLKQQLQLGAQMPAFSQVELVTRKTVTREELISKARAASGIVFIFGDLSSGSGSGPYGPSFGPGGSSTLPLPAWDVAEQVSVELQPKPVVVLVTRQIGLDFLYGDLRNKTPDYLVLADYADAMRTAFRQPQSRSGPYYPPYYGGPPGRDPSLRQLFNLPENLVSIAAFDSDGKVVYVKADAASSFLPSLGEARLALKGK